VKPRRRPCGYTLIELMIVIAILAILSAVVIPEFGYLIEKTEEGSTKANLGSLRSALSIYYSDMEGVYPSDINDLVPNYIQQIPTAVYPAHQP
jgi:prepilin-type N-terminal cleavage/methylation domain-containing protein